MNGDLEAFDNFYESAIEHMESESSERINRKHRTMVNR